MHHDLMVGSGGQILVISFVMNVFYVLALNLSVMCLGSLIFMIEFLKYRWHAEWKLARTAAFCENM